MSEELVYPCKAIVIASPDQIARDGLDYIIETGERITLTKEFTDYGDIRHRFTSKLVVDNTYSILRSYFIKLYV